MKLKFAVVEIQKIITVNELSSITVNLKCV